jgi:hypothetical protein
MSKIISPFAVLFVIGRHRSHTIITEIQEAEIDNMKGLIFYKDFLRDDGDLHLPIEHQDEKREFLQLLQNAEKSTATLKALRIEYYYKLRFTLTVEKERLLTVTVYRTEETTDTGIISIDQGDVMVTDAGTIPADKICLTIKRNV